jgi:hypothetical protein
VIEQSAWRGRSARSQRQTTSGLGARSLRGVFVNRVATEYNHARDATAKHDEVRGRALVVLFFVATANAQVPEPAGTPGGVDPDGAYRIGNGVTAPSILTRVDYDIPDLARRLHASGDVLLSIVVRSDGTVRMFRWSSPLATAWNMRTKND